MTPRGRGADRAPADRGPSRQGERFEVEVGPVAHGGHCVARVSETGADSRVVFVRHALPGERVVVEITEGAERDRFWRGDAVAVPGPDPDRVTPPCPYAGPGRCGGCDFQHVAVSRQRELKQAVVREQLQRLAGLDVPVTVEPVPGDDEGLRWRTRMSYVTTPEGQRGMYRHRSHQVEPTPDCRIAHPRALTLVDGEPVGEAAGTVVAEVAVAGRQRRFARAGDGFWQAHPGAPAALVAAVQQALAPRPGESLLDLYAGVGLFAGFLGEQLGEEGRVTAVEGDRVAAGHAAENLADLARCRVVTGDVRRVLQRGRDVPDRADLVVLDPPREGARRPVVAALAARRPRAVAYVSCDPAALARDTALLAEQGYALGSLRALDLFPMTQHVECVAQFVPRG